jgi:hypothetical protein
VQIGAFASAAQAVTGWREAAAAFPAFVDGKAQVVEPVERAGQTLYRASVDGFADTAAAQAFCDALKARGRGCIIKIRTDAPTATAAATPVARPAPTPAPRQTDGYTLAAASLSPSARDIPLSHEGQAIDASPSTILEETRP